MLKGSAIRGGDWYFPESVEMIHETSVGWPICELFRLAIWVMRLSVDCCRVLNHTCDAVTAVQPKWSHERRDGAGLDGLICPPVVRVCHSWEGQHFLDIGMKFDVSLSSKVHPQSASVVTSRFCHSGCDHLVNGWCYGS